MSAEGHADERGQANVASLTTDLRAAQANCRDYAERIKQLEAALLEIRDAKSRWQTGVGSYAGGETHFGFAQRLQRIAREALASTPSIESAPTAPDTRDEQAGQRKSYDEIVADKEALAERMRTLRAERDAEKARADAAEAELTKLRAVANAAGEFIATRTAASRVRLESALNAAKSEKGEPA